MPERLDTVQDFERAFEMDPAPAEHSAGGDQPRPGGKAAAGSAFALSRSYEVKGVVFSEIALRPPRGLEFWEHGDPFEWQLINGRPIRIENIPAVRAYAERCVSVPGEASVSGAAIVEALNLRDTLSLRKAVTGFFTERDETGSP